ncbi:MAG: hypothetical protein P1V33_11265 [Pseudohongiella nitratireducens]|nr:hypothetical protein [Pseudohongiella nitratireducens]MDF1624036.1 hypothetical protein [Pseudohongiella nitratireducens]
MIRLYIVWVLVASLFTSAGLSADTVFYQPAPTDASVSSAQWQQIWRETKLQGYDAVVVQWSRIGATDYLGWPDTENRTAHSEGQAWFRRALQLAVAADLQLVLGLYAEADMSETLAGDDAVYYLHHLLSHSRLQMEKATAWELPVSAWFIPLGLEDRHLRQPALLDEVAQQIRSLKRLTTLPLALNIMSSGLYTPDRFADWLHVLSDDGLRLWWQPSPEVFLPPLVVDAYLQQMGCGVGIVNIQGVVKDQEDEAFRACHRLATGSLRELPGVQMQFSSQP